jgi:hypothetical protein
VQALWKEIVRWWLEFWGRKQSPKVYSFPENEVVTSESSFSIPFWAQAKYLNLHPTLYAVAISPDGKLQNLRGGYNFPLLPGRYIMHYVDKRDRIGAIPKTSETTQDGANISLELIITYRVSDPIKLFEIQQPVDILLSLIRSDLMEFIRIHRYDEVVGSNDGQTIDSSRVARYIKEQHNSRYQISRVFTLMNVVVVEKVGDPKLIVIRKNFQVQQKQNVADSELLKQNQELEKKVAFQEAEIKSIKAQADVTQQNILQKMKLQEIELEKARNDLQWRQEKWSRAMDAISQTLTTPNYQRDQRELELIGQIMNELKLLTGQGVDSGADGQKNTLSEAVNKKSGNKIDTLTDTLLSLLNRKKP